MADIRPRKIIHDNGQWWWLRRRFLEYIRFDDGILYSVVVWFLFLFWCMDILSLICVGFCCACFCSCCWWCCCCFFDCWCPTNTMISFDLNEKVYFLVKNCILCFAFDLNKMFDFHTNTMSHMEYEFCLSKIECSKRSSIRSIQSNCISK